jgi:four helix bundle protein
MQDYHDLLVWKETFSFVKLIYRLSGHFPKEEMFGITSQLRRAAVSVMANIVEGRGKNSDKDFLRFLYISKGSLNECQCYLELVLDLEFVNKEQFDFIENKRKQVGYLLFKLIKSLEKYKASQASLAS